ncbi:hypothetical protein LLE49_24300, partial [Alicyclobacillus tolerans]|uniref:hypothetical protein n=1 Tax=Alicyclobacillus tolerans TaxID=90970 RepID=UPI001F3F795A
ILNLAGNREIKTIIVVNLTEPTRGAITLQVYNMVPYLQNKLLRTYNKRKCLYHQDMVDVSRRLNRFMMQEQSQINALDSEV